jgi:hypothetical protein
LILQDEQKIDTRFKCVGLLNRIESKEIIIGYDFDLRTNKINSKKINNCNVGKEHKFKAYRLTTQSEKEVSLLISNG